MTKYLTTSDGRPLTLGGMLFLVPEAGQGGGNPDSGDPGGEIPAGGTLSITVAPYYLGNSRARFVHQPTAASGNTLARVPVAFAYTGDQPTSVQARAVNLAASGAAVTQWTELDGLTCDDATKTGYGFMLDVPLGADNGTQIRVGTSATITHSSTQKWEVGPRTRMMGQSNSVGLLNGNRTYTDQVPGAHPARTELGYWANENAGAFFGIDGPVAPGGISGATGSTSMGSDTGPGTGGALAWLRILGDRLKAKHGRKVGVALNAWTHNGKVIAQFLPGGELNKMESNSGTAVGSIGWSSPLAYGGGDYQFVAWHQGETESSTLTRAQRRDQLIAFCQMHHAHVAQFWRTPAQLTIAFCVLGVYESVTNVEALRGAVYDVVAHGKAQGWDVRIAMSCIDLDPVVIGDGLHFGGDFKRQGHARLMQTVLNAVDPVGVPYGGEGPRLTGQAVRSGDDVMLTVAHNGGVALAAKNSAAPITGWYANTLADFSGADIALTNVTILSPTQIRVTATGAPATFFIKHCGGKAKTVQSYRPDVSNLIYDDFVYPTGANAGDQYTGRPLHETPDAIKVGP